MAGAAASEREGEREARLLLQLTRLVPAHAGEGSGLHPWAERLGTSVVRGLLQHNKCRLCGERACSLVVTRASVAPQSPTPRGSKYSRI